MANTLPATQASQRNKRNRLAKREFSPRISERDLEAFMLHTHHGLSVQTIAQELRMDEEKVAAAVMKGYCYFATHSPIVAASKFTDILGIVRDKIERVLSAGLTAKERKQLTDGTIARVPNWNVRLATLDRANKILELVLPKKGGGGVNINFGGQGPQSPTSGKVSYEALLDKVKAEALEVEDVEVQAEVEQSEALGLVAEPPANA